jgi:hypothetical protein
MKLIERGGRRRKMPRVALVRWRKARLSASGRNTGFVEHVKKQKKGNRSTKRVYKVNMGSRI